MVVVICEVKLNDCRSVFLMWRMATSTQVEMNNRLCQLSLEVCEFISCQTYM